MKFAKKNLDYKIKLRQCLGNFTQILFVRTLAWKFKYLMKFSLENAIFTLGIICIFYPQKRQ